MCHIFSLRLVHLLTSVADSGGVRGVQMHPPLAASNVFFAYITARVHQMIMQELHATTTRQVTHSRISSLLISRHLTRPRVASRYSVWTSSVTESGRGNPKICGRASHANG